MKGLVLRNNKYSTKLWSEFLEKSLRSESFECDDEAARIYSRVPYLSGFGNALSFDKRKLDL